MVLHVCENQRCTGIELVDSSLEDFLQTALCNHNKFKDSWILSCCRDHLIFLTFFLLEIGNEASEPLKQS